MLEMEVNYYVPLKMQGLLDHAQKLLPIKMSIQRDFNFHPTWSNKFEVLYDVFKDIFHDIKVT